MEINVDSNDLAELAEKSEVLSYLEQQSRILRIVLTRAKEDHKTFWESMVRKYKIEPNDTFSIDRVNNKLIKKD